VTEISHPVGVGVWGLGRHACRKILPALAMCPNTTLVGVTTRDDQVAFREAERYNCRYWATPQDMFGEEDVDAVYVATPTGLHHAHGMEVLKAGKHLWSEKALTDSLSQAQELVRESYERDLGLCEGLMYLYHPQFSFIVDAVTQPSFGRILSINCQFGLPPLGEPGFRFDPELGGGALLDVAPYPVSAAHRLLGTDLELVNSVLFEPSGFGVDTHGFALLSREDGACAFLEWGYNRAYKNEISVWGENGSLYSDFIFSKPPDHQSRVSVRDQHGEVRYEDIEPANSFCRMFCAFSKTLSDKEGRDHLREEAELQAEYLERLRRGR